MSWICKKCETENPDGINVCEVCDSPKPRKVTVKQHVGLLSYYKDFLRNQDLYLSELAQERELKAKAELGDINAMKELAKKYEIGTIGYCPNEAEAFKWYLEAAEHDDMESQYKVANCYYYGRMTLKDESESKKWFERAADNGSKEARTILEYLYRPPVKEETGCLSMVLSVLFFVIFNLALLL